MYRNLEKRVGVSRWMGEALVYFFGSYASGLKTATSDCDIVFIPEEVPGVELICKLLSCVAAVLEKRLRNDATTCKLPCTPCFLFCLFLSCFLFAFFIGLQE